MISKAPQSWHNSPTDFHFCPSDLGALTNRLRVSGSEHVRLCLSMGESLASVPAPGKSGPGESLTLQDRRNRGELLTKTGFGHFEHMVSHSLKKLASDCPETHSRRPGRPERPGFLTVGSAQRWEALVAGDESRDMSVNLPARRGHGLAVRQTRKDPAIGEVSRFMCKRCVSALRCTTDFTATGLKSREV